MTLTLECALSGRCNGYAASAPQIGLAGHGASTVLAEIDLRRAVAAWVRGLAEVGELEGAVDRAGLRFEPSDGPLVIQLVPA